MAKQQTPQTIELPALNIQTMQVKLVGDSPLITHAWSEKARKQMLDRQTKAARQAKAAKDPFRDFCDSMYWLTPKPADPQPADVEAARFGFPIVGFKSCAVDACSHIEGVTKVQARGAFHFIGEMAAIVGDGPHMREDLVRVGMGTADLRYRGEFRDWSTVLTIRYNENVLSAAQIVNMLNTGGFAIGVGEWRPQRDGSYGMFHVATGKES